MAGISNELLRLSTTIRELQPIVAKLGEIDSFVSSILNMVDQEIYTQQEADGIVREYKAGALQGVNDIINKFRATANDIAKTSVVEANDKVKNITPMIQGSPVITPLPVIYVGENVTILSQESVLSAQMSNILSQIQNSLS